jgi:hypothetical protein
MRRILDMKIERSEEGLGADIGGRSDGASRSDDVAAGADRDRYSTELGTWCRSRQAAPKYLWNPSCVLPYQRGQLTSAVMPF